MTSSAKSSPKFRTELHGPEFSWGPGPPTILTWRAIDRHVDAVHMRHMH